MPLKALKSLGQNFLVDKNIIKKIISAADMHSNETVFEIGPGRGAITFELAKRAKKVIAIEKDRGLAKELQKTIKSQGLSNIEIIHGDALKINTEMLRRNISNYKVISNPPYDIASRLLIDFLVSDNPAYKIVFVVQKEIAQKAIAKPGHNTLFTVLIQTFGKPKIITNIPRSCFSPQPRVDSAILSIDPIKDIEISDKNKFVQLVKAGFSSKRKFLINNLSNKLKIERPKLQAAFKETGLNEKIRAEKLEVNEWKDLTLSLKGLY